MEGRLLHWWDDTVRKHKKSLALVSVNESYTFEELDNKGNQLAEFLTAHGVSSNDIVAIITDICSELVCAILASIKIQAVYMHVDKSYPKKIIAKVMDCVNPKLILQTGANVTVEKWKESGRFETITLFEPTDHELTKYEKLLKPSEETLKNGSCKGDSQQSSDVKIAYIALTSGTTGCPKAIRGTEKGLVHSMKTFLQSYPFTQGDNREACYVAFIWEFLRPLLSGCPLFLIPKHVITCGNKLTQYLVQNHITRIFITSSILEILLMNGEKAACLKTIILCGEPVSKSLLQRALNVLPWVRFINLYGISEAADVASVDLCAWYDSEEDIEDYQYCPVGKSIPGVRMVVLDEAMNPCPVGELGEIFISGSTVADGYIGLPDQNRSSFLHCHEALEKFQFSGPAYRSGDRGRFHSNEYLEVMGRNATTEILIRGQKVDLKVIEHCIFELPEVQSCAVAFVDGDIVAVVACALQTDDVHMHLSEHLPQPFVPSIIQCNPQLPICAQTGKVDIKAVKLTKNEQEFHTSTEQALSKIWFEVLGHMSFDHSSNFFQVGGHSLLIGKLLSKMNSEFNTNFKVEHLFEHKKLSDMAILIEKKHPGYTFDLDDEWREVRNTFGKIPNRTTSRQGILLTGATGYLGGYILTQLLSMTNMNVVCLVRTHKSEKNVKGRLLDSLHEKRAYSDEIREQFEKRVVVLETELSQPYFNLSKKDFDSLQHRVEIVVHCAASVNMLYPYKVLKKANVEATANILYFCLSSCPRKELHYISSVSVLDKNSELMSSKTLPQSGYTQSKLLAEKLVQQVSDDTNLHVTVYRPGYLSPDTATGVWNQKDAVYRFLSRCIATRTLPYDLLLDLTPVTFAASFVIHVILKNTAKCATYNLSNPSWVHITPELFSTSGVNDIKTVTWKEWEEENPDEFLGSGIQDPVRYNMKETMKALQDWELEYPVITKEVFSLYLKNISK